MKRFTKFILLLLAVIIIALAIIFVRPYFAKETVNIVLDGKQLDLQTEPIVKNKVTYVSIHDLAAIFGAAFFAEEGTNTFSFTLFENQVLINFAEKKAFVNGEEVTFPNVIRAKESYFVPVRFIGDALQVEIHWNEDDGTVDVQRADSIVDAKYQVAFLPLDSRPINFSGPMKAALSAGMELVAPEKDSLGNLEEAGNSNELATWLMEQKDEVQAYVVSADMLAYGGLVASRMSDVSLEEALERIEVIKDLKEAHRHIPVYVHDSIQRLAITASSQEMLIHYNNIREWAILYDRVHHFGQDEYKEELEQYEKEIPVHVLEEYLSTRLRNHTINMELLKYVKDGYIDYLVLSVDDAAEYGLQRHEKEQLIEKVKELQIEDKVEIYSGTDENGFTLLARLATYFYNVKPKVYVQYIGLPSNDYVANYEDIPLIENVQKHLRVVGANVVSSKEEAHIHLHVYLRDWSKERHDMINEGVHAVKQSIESGKYTIVADTGFYKDVPFLIRKLRDEQLVNELFSYAAWNTAGNTIGVVSGHAVMRYSYLHGNSNQHESVKRMATKNHVEYLLHRYVKDNGYKIEIIDQVSDYVTNRGLDRRNLTEDAKHITEYAHTLIERNFQEWYQYFLTDPIVVERKEHENLTESISDYELTHVSFPWNRLFEAEIDFEKLNE